MTYVNIPALAQVARPSVQLHDGKATTTSIEVARIFDKRHDNVMRDIQNLISDGSSSISVGANEHFWGVVAGSWR